MTRIWVFAERIGYALAQVALHIGLAIHREMLVFPAVGTQVVDATHMVVMLVCDQKGINIYGTWHVKHLHIEIRATVNQQVSTVGALHKGRAAQPPVVRVG